MRKPDVCQRGFDFLAPDEAAVISGVMRKCKGPVCIAKDPNGILKPVDDFPKLTKKSKCTWCKECIAIQKKKSKQAKERIEKTKSKIKEKDPEIDIPIEEYNEIHNLQNGVCAICKTPEFREAIEGKGYEPVPLRVDREPESSKIRGLLCSKCYLRVRQLGWIMDNLDWLNTAEDYRAKFQVHKDKSSAT